MSRAGALSTLALTGCSGRAFGWANFFCGAEIDFDEDYVSNVAISAKTILYPRTLVEESQVNGITLERQTCWMPLDCMDKCDYMERNARAGGLPAPTACAMCDPPCPSNPGETLVSLVQAFRDDIVSALRLAAICLNPVACVCQVFMMLKPAWIDNLPNEIQECSVSDLMMLILDKVAIGMIGLLEGVANGLIVDPLNKILKPIKEVKIGWKTNVLGADIGFELKPFDFINLIKRACIPYKDIKDCKSDKEQAELAALLGCSFDDRSLWKRCYYERVRPARRTRLRAPTTPRTHTPCVAGQVHLPGGRRHGQRVQGPL